MKFKRLALGLLLTISSVGLLNSCGSNKKPTGNLPSPDNPNENEDNKDPNKPDGDEGNDKPGGDEGNTNPDNPKPPKDPDLNTNVFFGSFYNGFDISEDCAITLMTTAKDGLDLKGKTFKIYNWANVIYEYKFEETLMLYKDYPLVFANKEFTKTDLIPNYKIISLDQPLVRHVYNYEIIGTDDKVIDSLGVKNLKIPLGHKQTLIRLQDFLKPRSAYRDLDFIRVNNVQDKFLTPLNYKLTLEELLTGPRIDEILYGKLPFSVDGQGQVGTGGYCKVTNPRYEDGDTTQFDFPKGSGIPHGHDYRVRYLYIDTPEIKHPNIPAEPWGYAAKDFTNSRLRSATSIIVQSDITGNLKDTYGRTLGFVWYSTVKNPSILDYRLLNFEIIAAGLAQSSDFSNHTNPYKELNWQGINYYVYCKYGYNYAAELGIKIHGEEDPSFNK